MDRNLKAFLAVAREGNLTAAAEKIGLSQPALTKTIRRLELEFGSQIFHRTTRGMELTVAGRKLLERARAIETHHRHAREEIRALGKGSVEMFTIAAGMSYQMAIAPDLVKRLSLEFPQTRFTLDYNLADTTFPQLLEGRVDLLLGILRGEPPEGIETRQLFNVEMCVYCCSDDPLAQSDSIAARDLSDHRWIVYKRDGTVVERLKTYFRDRRLRSPEIVMEVETLAASFRIISGTSYFTLAPVQVEAMAKAAGLKKLLFEDPFWRFPSGACFRRSTSEFPILARSLDLLSQLVDKQGTPV